MRAAVIQFPGSNCDRDMAVALKAAGAMSQWCGTKIPICPMVWISWQSLVDFHLAIICALVRLPRGPQFVSRSWPCKSRWICVRRLQRISGSDRNGPVAGCLVAQCGLKYICKHVELNVETTQSAYTSAYKADQSITIPIAHHDGNYNLDDAMRRPV